MRWLVSMPQLSLLCAACLPASHARSRQSEGPQLLHVVRTKLLRHGGLRNRLGLGEFQLAALVHRLVLQPPTVLHVLHAAQVAAPAEHQGHLLGGHMDPLR